MEQGSVFESIRGQVVRLPNSMALPPGVTRVDVVAVGDTRILMLADASWDTWFAGESVTPDFMAEWDQPEK